VASKAFHAAFEVVVGLASPQGCGTIEQVGATVGSR